VRACATVSVSGDSATGGAFALEVALDALLGVLPGVRFRKDSRPMKS
jgi:hypothetical protein